MLCRANSKRTVLRRDQCNFMHWLCRRCVVAMLELKANRTLIVGPEAEAEIAEARTGMMIEAPAWVLSLLLLWRRC